MEKVLIKMSELGATVDGKEAYLEVTSKVVYLPKSGANKIERSVLQDCEVTRVKISEQVPQMPPGYLEDAGFEHLGQVPVDNEMFQRPMAEVANVKQRGANRNWGNNTYVFKVLPRHKGEEISAVSVKELENAVRYWSPKNPDGKLGEDIDAIKSYLESR